MSYILDALQKSEQERKQQVMPNLHAAAPVAPTTRRWWPWIAAIGLLLLSINMAALWYWLTPSTESTMAIASTLSSALPRQAEMLAKSTPTAATADSVTDATLDTSADPLTDSTVDSEVQTRDLIVNAPQRVTPAEFTDLDSLRAITPVRITALPVDIQQQIPSLTFSSHLYSDDFRMVNINGRMMRESEYIDAELQLIEITEDGVILRFREYYVEMSILQNWSFD
jgi:general secretion pathway protein B